MLTVTRLASVVITSLMLYLSPPSFSSLFSWHPSLLTVAFCLAMPEGQLTFGLHYPYQSLGGRKDRVYYHWLMQNIAYSAALVGGFAVVYNKYLNDFPHLATWHAISGAFTMATASAQVMIGGCLSYPWLFPEHLVSSAKWAHLWVGSITIYSGFQTLLLATWSNWATKAMTFPSLVIMRIAFAVAVFSHGRHFLMKYGRKMTKKVQVGMEGSQENSKKQDSVSPLSSRDSISKLSSSASVTD